MKRLFYGIMAIVFCVSVFSSSAMAGSKQRHRWEGVAIGIGASIIGGAILHSMHQQYRYNPEPAPQIRYEREERAYYTPPQRHYDNYDRLHPSPPPRGCGHWEIRKFWVPPVYEKVWNPGHYNRWNEWVPGHWIEIEKSPGYWREERVWVADR